MNYELVRRTSLAALIVSPTMILVAMQMPFWLPPPRQPALQRVVYTDLGLPWDCRGPAAWAVEASASPCEFPLQSDDACRVIRTPAGIGI